MKTVEDFLNEINERSWRQNISSEAERKFDELIEEFKEHKDEIISEMIKDIKTMEKIKLEDNQVFNYSIFRTWLDFCARQIMSDTIRKNNE